MSAMNSIKIDRFLAVLSLVGLILAGVMIMTIKGVLGAVNTSKEIDDSIMIETRLKTDKFNEVYQKATQKKPVPLDL